MDPYNPEVKEENDSEDEASPSTIITDKSLHAQFGIKEENEGSFSENDQFMVEVKEEIDVKIEEEDLPPPEDPLILCDQEGPSSEENGSKKRINTENDTQKIIVSSNKTDRESHPVKRFKSLKEAREDNSNSSDLFHSSSNIKDSDCKEKWQQLRSNFMREKKKFDALPSGSATVKARKWAFYDAMTFLTPCVTPRATSSNVSSPLEEMNTELDAEGEGATLDDTDNSGSASTASNVNANEKQTSASAIKQPKNKGAYKKRRGNLEHDDVDEQLMGELRKMREQAVSKEKEESDSDHLFLLSLLPLMKKLSPMDNLDAKIEIQQIFRRKLAANKTSSYGYSTASQPATYARKTPSRHAYAQPAPYPCETQAPYAYETTSPYASQRTSPVCHETSLLHDLDTPAFVSNSVSM